MANNIILGAGVTGLTAGIKTGYPIYEASDTAGGLCRSYNKNGYRFERGGGHWIFGGGESIDFLSSYGKLKKYKRKAGVYYNQIFDAPIQNYFKENELIEDGTMQDWLINRFGYEQCRLFFFPFNKKYTCGYYESCIQDDEHKSPTDNKIYNDEFYYPEHGLANLVDSMADKCDVHYNKRAISVNIKKKNVTFSDGTSIKYDKLISTIPLKNMLTLIGVDSPDLVRTSVAVTNIGAERAFKCPHKHWLYIPDEKIPFFRVGFYSNVSRDFAFIKDGVAIGVETAFIGEPPTTYHRMKTANTIRDWNWIAEIDVIDEHIIDTAYTWMHKGHNREEYLKMLEENDIVSTGRYGKWKFQGIVDCVKDGLCLEKN